MSDHPLAAQFKAVFLKHRFRSDAPVLREIIPDLVAAVPVPSREAVEALFREHGIWNIRRSDNSYYFETHDTHSLIDDLYALLTPTGKLTWCAHIVWRALDKDISTFEGYIFIGDNFTLELLNSANDATTWDICPVKGCHAKRPEGAA